MDVSRDLAMKQSQSTSLAVTARVWSGCTEVTLFLQAKVWFHPVGLDQRNLRTMFIDRSLGRIRTGC